MPEEQASRFIQFFFSACKRTAAQVKAEEGGARELLWSVDLQRSPTPKNNAR